MLVIFCYSVPDQEQALKNAQWIAELDSYKNHDIFVLADHRCDPEINKAISGSFGPAFRMVDHRLTKASIDGWPQGANHMFGLATAMIQAQHNWPCFLWLEPDAIPLTPGWLDALEAEYRRAGKPFMGEKVDLGEKRPDVPIHMSGVGIYQNPIYLLAGEAYRAHDTAWDIAAKDQILPHCHFTKLIQHYWKHGTFTHLDEIRPETVLFHSSKDGSLIDVLRRNAAPETNRTSVPTEPTTAREGVSREEIGTRAAQPIRKLRSDIWVLEGDSIISEQVALTGKLDFDTLIPHVLGHIRPGDTVVDVGAFIGDHTVAYSHAVGKAGKVIAYEPNPLAFQCLVHNTGSMSNVFGFCHALGKEKGKASLSGGEFASSYIENGIDGDITVKPFDDDISLFSQIDLIKIDVEGYELNVLKGAEQLINKFHPKLVVEINEIALTRQNITPDDVVKWIVPHGYSVSILHQHKDAPFYDILAVANQPPEISRDAPAHDSAASPPVAPSSDVTITPDMIKSFINTIKEFSNASPKNKSIVSQTLVYAGLRKPNEKKKHGKNPFAKTTHRKRKQPTEEHQT